MLGLSFLVELGSVAALTGAGAWFAYRAFYVAVPPNKALVLFGRRSRPATERNGTTGSDVTTRPPRVLVGGGAVMAPWNKTHAFLSLAPIDLEATVRTVHAVEGGSAAGWEVSLAVQAKVPAEPGALRAAAENLLGLGSDEVVAFVRRSVEASVPVVLARVGPADAEPDWEQLGSEIQATVGPELIRSGLMVRSVSVRELRRIAPAVPLPVPREARATPRVPTAATPSPPQDVDQRLSRIERGLDVMGTQVDRWLRERSPGARRDEGPYGLELEPLAVVPGDGVLDDSMEDGRPPPARSPPRAVREDAGGEPPTPSDGKPPR